MLSATTKGQLCSRLLAICSITLVVSSAVAAPPPGKGNGGNGGGGGGGKDNEPEVTFQIKWFGNPFGVGTVSASSYSVTDLNNAGDFVGRASYADGSRIALWYDADDGDNGTLKDMNTLAVPDGWTAVFAWGINDNGQIAVLMNHNDGSRAIWRYDSVLDQFTLIHQAAFGGAAINNWGDIAFPSDEDGADSWRLYTEATGEISTPMIDGAPILGSVNGVNDFLQIVGSYPSPSNMIRF